MQETGYETFSFYYDALTERGLSGESSISGRTGAEIPALRRKGHAGSGVRYGNTYRGNGETWI